MQIEVGLEAIHVDDGLLAVDSFMNGVSGRIGIRRENFGCPACWSQQHNGLFQLQKCLHQSRHKRGLSSPRIAPQKKKCIWVSAK